MAQMVMKKKKLCDYVLCTKTVIDKDYCDEVCWNRQIIYDRFNGRSALNPSHPAEVMHEIVPRSLRPRNWWTLDNMIPLTNAEHRKIHDEGAKKYRNQLQEIVNGVR